MVCPLLNDAVTVPDLPLVGFVTVVKKHVAFLGVVVAGAITDNDA